MLGECKYSQLAGDDYIAPLLSELNALTPSGFSDYCVSVLSAAKYEDVKLAKAHGLTGLHVWAMKDGVAYGIRCTRPKMQVGQAVVQQAMGACCLHDIVPMVMTTNVFSKEAIMLATASNPPVVLFDRYQFYEDKVQRWLRTCNLKLEYSAAVRQPFRLYTKYTMKNGDRFYVLNCTELESVRALSSILGEVLRDGCQVYVTDVFDSNFSVPAVGMFSYNIPEYVERLYVTHAQMGFVYLSVSRRMNVVQIGMPQLKSRAPADAYRL